MWLMEAFNIHALIVFSSYNNLHESCIQKLHDIELRIFCLFFSHVICIKNQRVYTITMQHR